MSGAVFTAMGASYSVTSYLGGKIVISLGYPALFLTTASIAAAGMLLFWAFFRLRKARRDAEAQKFSKEQSTR